VRFIKKDMFLKNLHFTVRNFRNQKLFTFVNLAGLTIGIIALVIALITVSFQSWIAATKNPVNASESI